MDFQSKFFEILLDDNFNFDLHSSSFAYFAASKCAKLFNFVLFKQNSIEKNFSRIRTRIAKIEGESSVDHHYHHGPLITILFGKCFKLKIKLRDLLVDQNGHFHTIVTTLYVKLDHRALWMQEVRTEGLKLVLFRVSPYAVCLQRLKFKRLAIFELNPNSTKLVTRWRFESRP